MTEAGTWPVWRRHRAYFLLAAASAAVLALVGYVLVMHYGLPALRPHYLPPLELRDPWHGGPLPATTRGVSPGDRFLDGYRVDATGRRTDDLPCDGYPACRSLRGATDHVTVSSPPRATGRSS